METFVVRRAGRVRDEALNVDALVLAEHEDGAGRHLEFQRAFEEDAQDRELGLVGPCVVNELQKTVYGGVLSWSLSSSRLVVELDQRASDILGADGGYELTLALNGDDASIVGPALKEILGPGRA